MSFEAAKFEAVPCVFKGRAEDGNEASLFGLLIRPSSSSHQPQISTSSNSATSTLIPVPAPSGSAIQIVPSHTLNVSASKPAIAPSSGRNSRSSRHTTTCNLSTVTSSAAINSSTSHTPISISPKVAGGPSRVGSQYPPPPAQLVQIQPQWANPSPSGASTSSQITYPLQQHHFEINAGIPLASGHTKRGMSNSCKVGFESTSPSQVVPQLLDALGGSVPPTSHPSTSTAYSGMQGITSMHSPQLKPATNLPGELRQGVEALEDLNSIDFTQLVQPNSAIITTEDYLPQTNSTMTYVGAMDMCGGSGPTTQEIGIHIESGKEMMQTTQFQQYLQAGQRGFGQREQLGWQNIGIQQHHSSYVMAGGGQVVVGQINSSTPDSGIESGSPPSVSSYTPPMVSPYTTQVTSCDSGHYPLSIPNMSASSVNTVKSSNPDESDDFSDMPTLLPAITQQSGESLNDYTDDLNPPAMEEGNVSPPPTNPEAELNTKKVEMEAANTNNEMTNLLFAVTPSMDLSELAEKLYSSITPEQLRQLTNLIQSKAALVTESTSTTIQNNTASKKSKEKSSKSTKVKNGKEKSQKVAEPATALECMPQSTTDEEPCCLKSTESRCSSSLSNIQSEEKEEVWRCRLSVYRRHVRAQINEKLEKLIHSLEHSFEAVHLNMGTACKFPLPWQKLDWQRIAANKKANEMQLLKAASLAKKQEKMLRRKRKRMEKQKVSEMSDSEDGVVAKRKRGRPCSASSSTPQTSFDGKKVPAVRTYDEYVKIRTNVLLEAPSRIQEYIKCECCADSPCSATSRCVLRQQQMECSISSCSLFPVECQNRRIANNEGISQLHISQPTTSAFGVKAMVDVAKGQFICEYVGEVMRKETFLRRYTSRRQEQHRYGLEFTDGYVLDATKKGNISRFFNHSCRTNNCQLQRWQVNGFHRVGIFALTDISAGEELTYDYGDCTHVTLNSSQRCICSQETTLNHVKKPCSTSRHNKKRQLSRFNCQDGASGSGYSLPFLARNIRRRNTKSSSHKRLVPKLHFPDFLSDNQKDLSSVIQILLCLYKSFTKYCIRREKVSQRRIYQLQRSVQKILSCEQVDNLVNRFDAAVKHSLAIFQKSFDRRRFETIKQHYLSLKKAQAEELLRAYPSLSKQVYLSFLDERRRQPVLSVKKDTPKILTAEADLSYMDSAKLVGSTTPDQASRLTLSDNKDEDCVRCICGIMEDDGVMTQCDKCHFWLHADCLDFDIKTKKEFVCEFCTRNLECTPNVDIVLRPQPAIKFSGCTYYRTLVNSHGIQVRVNESVYVERLLNDEHKSILKRLHEQCAKSSSTINASIKKHESPDKSTSAKHFDSPKKIKKEAQNGDVKQKNYNKMEESIKDEIVSPAMNTWWHSGQQFNKREFHRKDLRTFRIERIFKGPNGQRFVFGVYYARPHETFCDSTRMFYKNELFWTPLFDTLPLDSVVGRCLILEPQIWISGRPKQPKYLEEDVFICEYQIDKHQRSFEKILPKNRYFINTESYVFDEFPKKLTLKRDFTPFILPSAGSKFERVEIKTDDRTSSLIKEMNMEHLENVCSKIKQKKRGT